MAKYKYTSTHNGKERVFETDDNNLYSVCAILAKQNKMYKIFVFQNRLKAMKYARKNHLQNVKIDFQGTVTKATDKAKTTGIKYYK